MDFLRWIYTSIVFLIPGQKPFLFIYSCRAIKSHTGQNISAKLSPAVWKAASAWFSHLFGYQKNLPLLLSSHKHPSFKSKPAEKQKPNPSDDCVTDCNMPVRSCDQRGEQEHASPDRQVCLFTAKSASSARHRARWVFVWSDLTLMISVWLPIRTSLPKVCVWWVTDATVSLHAVAKHHWKKLCMSIH